MKIEPNNSYNESQPNWEEITAFEYCESINGLFYYTYWATKYQYYYENTQD